MSILNPILQSVSPEHGTSGVVLRQPIYIEIIGPSLVDPRSFTEDQFALYGPGDVVYDTGPGTILNSGIADDPYRLIDNAIIRERIPGSYNVLLSGISGFSTFNSGNIGISGSTVWLQFIPSVPLSPNTDYQAVLVGDDFASGMGLTNSGRYLGLTSWVSEDTFTRTTGTASSGQLNVLTSYDRILPTALYNASGYNDTYSITITSGSSTGAPKFTWSKLSSVGTYSSEGAGPHDLGNNLTFEFDGAILNGQVYTLDVYTPKPLTTTYVWSFATSQLDASIPPVTPTLPTLVLDNTDTGGLIFDSTITDDNRLKVVASWPDPFEYAVMSGLPAVVLEFNKTLKPWLVTSGLISPTDFPFRLTPLAGMPNISVANSLVYPSVIEVSGVYLKLWL